MFGLKRKKDRQAGTPFTFRVSDVVEVPLRGTVLRLRVVEGTPAMADLGPGALLQLRSPAGEERRVSIAAHAVMSGKATQERLTRTGELDVLIADDTAGAPVEIGWMATGPVT